MSDKSKHLTSTEQRLLGCLVRNPGRIVTHRELLEAMSPGNATKTIHHVRAYIARFRKKIETNPAFPNVIITHYGQGYSFAGREEARWPLSEIARSP